MQFTHIPGAIEQSFVAFLANFLPQLIYQRDMVMHSLLYRMITYIIRRIVQIGFTGTNHQSIQLRKCIKYLFHQFANTMLSVWFRNINLSFFICQFCLMFFYQCRWKHEHIEHTINIQSFFLGIIIFRMNDMRFFCYPATRFRRIRKKGVIPTFPVDSELCRFKQEKNLRTISVCFQVRRG